MCQNNNGMKTILTLLSILLLTSLRSAQAPQASTQMAVAPDASRNTLVNKPLPDKRQNPIEKFIRSAKP